MKSNPPSHPLNCISILVISPRAGVETWGENDNPEACYRWAHSFAPILGSYSPSVTVTVTEAPKGHDSWSVKGVLGFAHL